jgi:predicted GNAT family acetyltransferase
MHTPSPTARHLESHDAPVVVHHNADAERFEATVDDRLCVAQYRRAGNVLTMTHTEVPDGVQRRGVAGELVRAAIDYARANTLRIAPLCSYVRGYFERHREAGDVLA